MATYEPPIENLPIFDPSVFIVENVPLTYNEALGSFLAYPVAQGTEDLSIINVNGLATFNANEIHNQIATFNNQIIINDVSNINTNLNGENIIVNDISNNKYCNIESDKITLFSPTTTNTLTTDSWSGNITSVNTSSNLTHYLGFFDSSGTGSGKIQKNENLSCNPSTSTISATNFIGSISNASKISLISDDSPSTCYIPFTKTTTPTDNSLYIDNTTLPLSYTPNSSTLTAAIFNGSASTVAVTDTNIDATYYLTFVGASGAGQTLRADINTAPLSYNPSTALLTVNSLALITTTSTPSYIGSALQISAGGMSFRNFQLLVGGTTNTISSLSTNAVRINGVYNICIVNSGTGNLTINTSLGLNTLTKYTSPIVVPANNVAIMTITILSANTITRIIVDAYNVV